MTSEPLEPNPARGTDDVDVPGGDLGVGGPADDAGDDQREQVPPGYRDDPDVTQGPVADGDSGLGDLRDPGTSAPA